MKKTWSFPRLFWTANTLELIERWAYYGIFNLLALYLTNSTESGALGFSQAEKGMIMGTVNAILYFLPVITGALADKFGYRRVLTIAFIILSSGYYLMGQVSSFAGVFLCFFYVAIGAALFKPVISATIARTTNESNASLGFGLFYLMVNIGGLAGPVVASELREISWNLMFLMSSIMILLNLIIVLLFFREPKGERNTDPLLKSIGTVFRNILEVLKDRRLALLLLIISGAWTVYWQYFYSLPVFIQQWTDTGILYKALHQLWPSAAKAVGTSEGIILAEKIIALDAFLIVSLQIFISMAIARIKAINSMAAGILINATGLGLAFMTANPFFLLVSIFIFSIGEMSFSPKILEYIGRIAPQNKEALYMGTQFLPVAAGNFVGGLLAGPVYEHFADRYTVLTGMVPENLRTGLSNEQLHKAALDYFQTDDAGLTRILWQEGQPWQFGVVLACIGLFTFISLLVYDYYISKSK